MSQTIRLFGQEIEIDFNENDELENLTQIETTNNDIHQTSPLFPQTQDNNNVLDHSNAQTQHSQLSSSTNTLTTSNETLNKFDNPHKKDKKHKKHKKDKKEHKKEKKHKHKSKHSSLEVKKEGEDDSPRKRKHKHKDKRNKNPVPVKHEIQETQTQNTEPQPSTQVPIPTEPIVDGTATLETQQESPLDTSMIENGIQAEPELFEEPPPEESMHDIHIPPTEDINQEQEHELHSNNNNNNNTHHSNEDNNHNNNHLDYSEFDSERLPLKQNLEPGEKVWIWWEGESSWFRGTLQNRKNSADPPEWVVLYDDQEIHSEYEDDDIVPENALNMFAELFDDKSFDTQVLCTAYKSSKGDANEMIDFVLAHEIVGKARDSSGRAKRPKRRNHSASKKPRLDRTSASEQPVALQQ